MIFRYLLIQVGNGVLVCIWAHAKVCALHTKSKCEWNIVLELNLIKDKIVFINGMYHTKRISDLFIAYTFKITLNEYNSFHLSQSHLKYR